MSPTRMSRPPNIVAIDLGAESCRISLLQWNDDGPQIDVIHRSSNGPVARGNSLHWDLQKLINEVKVGLRLCAERTRGPIASIGVDGWAVDYVRLNQDGVPIGAPFCYRDERTMVSEMATEKACPAAFLYRQTGVQPLRINTLYQLVADGQAGVPAHYRWVNLPEYVLSQLGGRLVSELTNAAHTGLLDARANAWNKEVFDRAGLDLEAAPELVATGTDIGTVSADLRMLPPFAETRLIAPACHDTASAVAGIPAEGDALGVHQLRYVVATWLASRSTCFGRRRAHCGIHQSAGCLRPILLPQKREWHVAIEASREAALSSRECVEHCGADCSGREDTNPARFVKRG